MKMRSLKKMGLWLTLAALASTSTVQAHHSGHHSHHSGHHSHHNKRPTITNSELAALLVQATAGLQLNITDLSTLFTVFSITRNASANPSLTAAYAADLASIGPGLEGILETLGVSRTDAINIITALGNLDLALVNFAALVLVNNPDPAAIDQASSDINTAGQAVIASLVALPALDPTTITNFLTTLLTAQLAEIQSLNNGDFAGAIANRNLAIQTGSALINYIVKQLSDANLKVIHG